MYGQDCPYSPYSEFVCKIVPNLWGNMPGPYSQFVRGQAIGQWHSGQRPLAIAAVLGIWKRTVEKWVQKIQIDGNVDSGKSTGRPRISNDRNNRVRTNEPSNVSQ